MTNLIARERQGEWERLAEAALDRADGAVSPLLDLPDEPLVSIRPERRSALPDFRELWAYRELLFFLTWRDVQVRYKQTLLGAAWAIIQPLFTMLIFSLFFGKMAKIGSDGLPYPLFAFAGLLPWTYFANALTSGGNSMVTNANLVTKVYFPRMLVPAAAVLAGLVDLAIALVVLVAMMAFYGVGLTWRVVLLPPLIGLTTLLALGVALGAAALNVRYRDVRYVLPFVVQLWMFVSPIIYPLSLVPARWRGLYLLNPMAGIITNIRAALFGRPSLDWAALAVATAVTAAVLAAAMYQFRRLEKDFADIV
jgi:lipopolysaccharide transport system permease protein